MTIFDFNSMGNGILDEDFDDETEDGEDEKDFDEQDY